MVEVGAPTLELPAVTHPSGRRNHHPGAADVRPPAQVDVLAMEAHRRVEPAKGAEQVGAHEDARRRDGEYVGHGIVLLLVDFADVDAASGFSEEVDVEADVLQQTRVVPGDDLRSDDAGVGAIQLLDHQSNGVWIEGDIVVTEAEETVVALDELRHDVGDRAETSIGPDRLDEGVGKDAVDPGCDVVVGSLGDKEDRAQGWVVLAGERLEALLEPRAGGVNDDSDHDGRRGNRSRSLSKFAVHGGLRLAVPRCPARHEVDNILQHRCHRRNLSRMCLQKLALRDMLFTCLPLTSPPST